MKLTVIGVGLIGGSFARALKKANVVDKVMGCGRDPDNLQRAVELGVIDDYCHDPAEAVADADFIFIAVPLGAMKSIFSSIKDHMKPSAVFTDGGSVKSSVVEDVIAVFGEVPGNFVPGHPIAGTENSGVEASFDTLYQNRRVILTPLDNTDNHAIETVERLWQKAGAEVSRMPVKHHDDVLAATSHLPHMLAFGLVDALAQQEQHTEIFKYAAGGFRDFTRIASSNPVMWRDICIANNQALGECLGTFANEMTDLAEAIKNRDSERLLTIFERAKKARDEFVDGTS